MRLSPKYALLAADRAAQAAHCTAIRPPDETTRARLRGRLHEPLHRRAHSHRRRSDIRARHGSACRWRIRIDQRSGQGRFFGRHRSRLRRRSGAPRARSACRTSRTASRNAPSFGSRHRHDGPGLARDRIAQPASVDCSTRRRPNCFLVPFCSKPEHERRFALPRSSTISMPEWPPLQPLHLDEESRRGQRVRILLHRKKSSTQVEPSGAAHVQLALGLRVEIDQYVAPAAFRLSARIAPTMPVSSGGGDQRLDRTVLRYRPIPARPVWRP